MRIDPDFIGDMAADPELMKIVTAIVQLGDNLNLPIAAKGLRDAETQERLRIIGCAHGQGPFYGAPMDLGQVRQLGGKAVAGGECLIVPFPTIPRLAG